MAVEQLVCHLANSILVGHLNHLRPEPLNADGRALIMIVGDGIRNEAEILLGDLHRYARFEFTLALIELAVFRMPEPNRLLIRPRTLAKTEMVRRVMFSTTAEAPSAGQAAPVSEKVETLSSEAYWLALHASTPHARPALERLIETAEPLGVYPEFQASLNLKRARPAGSSPVNVGYILRSGVLWTGVAAYRVPKDSARARKGGCVNPLAWFEVVRPDGGRRMTAMGGKRSFVDGERLLAMNHQAALR